MLVCCQVPPTPVKVEVSYVTPNVNVPKNVTQLQTQGASWQWG